ncbi:MAG: hypothetical protein ABEJ06_00360 [Haloarculaceae archaeon]
MEAPTREDGPDRDAETTTDAARSVSRRRVLERGGLAAGALVLGTAALGGASATPSRVGAPGRGGEGIVHEDHYVPDAGFEIVSETVDDDNRLAFQCQTDAQTISFPRWRFEYVDDQPVTDDPRWLYTRDNNVDTDAVYRWKPRETGAKDCLVEGEPYVQSPFVLVRG